MHRFVRRRPLDSPPKTEQVVRDVLLEKIFDALVECGRLAPIRAGVAPMVKVTYSGTIQHGQELLHGLKIESRVATDSGITIYTSQAYVDEKLSRVEVVPLDDGRPASFLETAKATRRKAPWKRSMREMRDWLRDLAPNSGEDIYAN